ncbi:MAG: tryptophan--tRNA ligase [Patescibacteria group bacterium]
MKKTNETIALTGDRPTGRLHLGHYVGSIQNRIEMQKTADHAFYMIADVQALTDNAHNPEKVSENVIEVIMDNIACGVDPKKTTFFIQSQIPEIAEMTVLFLNLVTVARLKRNPTVKSEMKQKGFGEDVPAGFLSYPVSQAADILFLRATKVPVGEDQLPVIEQTNELVKKFNSIYGDFFAEAKPVLSDAGRLVGTDGQAKASKSLNNAIYLSDEDDVIAKKVMGMYTDPNHIKVEDPGKVEGNTVFTYLTIFDSRTEEVEELKKQYKKGGLGDVVLKKRLIQVLQDLIGPIRERRKLLEKDKKAVMKIVEKGTKKVQGMAKAYMDEMKTHMGIGYFN